MQVCVCVSPPVPKGSMPLFSECVCVGCCCFFRCTKYHDIVRDRMFVLGQKEGRCRMCNELGAKRRGEECSDGRCLKNWDIRSMPCFEGARFLRDANSYHIGITTMFIT